MFNKGISKIQCFYTFLLTLSLCDTYIVLAYRYCFIKKGVPLKGIITGVAENGPTEGENSWCLVLSRNKINSVLSFDEALPG